jgi:hypothetical protein
VIPSAFKKIVSSFKASLRATCSTEPHQWYHCIELQKRKTCSFFFPELVILCPLQVYHCDTFLCYERAIFLITFSVFQQQVQYSQHSTNVVSLIMSTFFAFSNKYWQLIM